MDTPTAKEDGVDDEKYTDHFIVVLQLDDDNADSLITTNLITTNLITRSS
jgi:hypothetical protein